MTLYIISISTGKSDVHIVFVFKNWATQTSFLTCCNTMQQKLGKLFYKFFHLKLNLSGKALRLSNMKKDQRDDIRSSCIYRSPENMCI